MKLQSFIIFLLTICIFVSLCIIPVSAAVAEGTFSSSVSWKIDLDTKTLTISGTGTIPRVSDIFRQQYSSDIHHIVIEEGITDVAAFALEDMIYVESIHFADSVKHIGDSAFMHCDSLMDVHFGKGITTIDFGAFDGARSLQTIILPPVFTSLSWYLFHYSGLVHFAVPEGVNTIEYGVFRECENLTHIYIPDSVTTIEFAAFDRCGKLDTIYYAGTQTQWDDINIDFDTSGGGDNNALINATIYYEHKHVWDVGTVVKEATCTEDGEQLYTCTICDAQELRTIAGSHAWDGGSVTATATCAKEGVKTYTCMHCDQTKTEPIEKSSVHTWDDGSVTTAATCAKEGIKTYTCICCNQTKTGPIEKSSAHLWDSSTNGNATTTHVCSICGETKSDPPATTNTPSTSPTTGPTETTTFPSDNENTSAEKGSTIPWGVIIISAVILLFGSGIGFILWLKKKHTVN